MNWTCPNCFFSNRPKNDICGGKGRLGCNFLRPSTDWYCQNCASLNPATCTLCRSCSIPKIAGAVTQTRSRRRHGFLFPEQPNAVGIRWRCSKCKWVNRSVNMRCGGNRKESNPGCGGLRDDCVDKSFRDEKWLCTCGFQNRPENDLCGGISDELGCKASRPAPWICVCGHMNGSNNMVCGGLGKEGCKKWRHKVGKDLKPEEEPVATIQTGTLRTNKRKFEEKDFEEFSLDLRMHLPPLKRKKIRNRKKSEHWTKEWGV